VVGVGGGGGGGGGGESGKGRDMLATSRLLYIFRSYCPT